MRSESKEEKITGESFERLIQIDGMDEETATILFDNGYRTPEDIAKATLAELTSFMGITEEKGTMLLHGALRYLANPPEQEDLEPETEDLAEDSTETQEAEATAAEEVPAEAVEQTAPEDVSAEAAEPTAPEDVSTETTEKEPDADEKAQTSKTPRRQTRRTA